MGMTVDGGRSLATTLGNKGGIGSEGTGEGMSKVKIYLHSWLRRVYISNNNENKVQKYKKKEKRIYLIILECRLPRCLDA